MEIYYGFEKNYGDITDIVYSKCLFQNYIIIPKDDNVRSQIFGDPCYGIRKHIKIIEGNNVKIYEHDEEVRLEIHVIQMKKTISPSERKKWWNEKGNKIEDTNLRLIELQRRLILNHGTFVDELPEQLMLIRYLDKKDKVLEIGSNIGRTACVISTILDDDKNFLTLECNKTYFEMILENKILNQMNFNIEPFALSKQNLIQRGIFTYVSDKIPEGFTKVDTITWDRLKEKYPIDFNVLVADCEGSLFHILHDEPDFLNHFNKVIMENDYTTIEQYQFVRDKLIQNGFINIFTQSGGWGCCYSFFYQVWLR